MAGSGSVGPIILGWPADNFSGQTKRATVNAMQITIKTLERLLAHSCIGPSGARGALLDTVRCGCSRFDHDLHSNETLNPYVRLWVI